MSGTEVRGAAQADRGVDVGALHDIPEGIVQTVSLNGRKAGLVRMGDKVRVLGNACPHNGGPLCEGRVRTVSHSDLPGEIVLLADRLVLSCPWHGWEFSLDSGRCISDQALRVRVYDAVVVDGRVIVK